MTPMTPMRWKLADLPSRLWIVWQPATDCAIASALTRREAIERACFNKSEPPTPWAEMRHCGFRCEIFKRSK